jgi:hypothetical protein
VTLNEFRDSLSAASAPGGLSSAARALWHEARGQWDEAHRLVQDVHTADDAWVHAYLHRKEGDHSNAAYWYRQARRPMQSGSLEDEWVAIVTELLEG